MATKTPLGDVCAHCDDGRGSRYVKIGIAFTEPDDNTGEPRVSIKLDAMPLPTAGWTGWLNIFPKGERK